MQNLNGKTFPLGKRSVESFPSGNVAVMREVVGVTNCDRRGQFTLSTRIPAHVTTYFGPAQGSEDF